jgi:diguanylate cyclase
MDVPRGNEHERTFAFAEIALGQIRALSQAAYPRNYEIWFNYATGYNPALNQFINQTLRERGTLTDADLEHIHATYIASTRMVDRIDEVNGRLIEEVRQVLETIGAAGDSASSYSDSLTDATERLSGADDRETVRTIIERLLISAKEMQTNNRALEMRLSASKQEIEQLQESLQAVLHESMTDPLTTLTNRKFFDYGFARAITEAKANGEPLSLLMCDVDHFKKFNDTYGHLTGDQVLRLVAISVKQNVKGQDIAARYGGEEFVIALPNTSLQSANTVAEHIRRAVMTKELVKRSTGENLGRVTLSLGAAVLRAQDTAQMLIDRADKCLYAAKRNGRNRVICETDPEANGALRRARTA